MTIPAVKKSEIVNKFRVHASDSGSPQVQVALLTERINTITGHLKIHRKDYASQRGLMKLVGLRNRLLRYLARIQRSDYTNLIQSLGLRK